MEWRRMGTKKPAHHDGSLMFDTMIGCNVVGEDRLG